MSPPIAACRCISPYSSSVSGPGLRRIRSAIAILPTSWRYPPIRMVVRSSSGRPIRIATPDLGEERMTVHPGHPDVGDDHVEPLRLEDAQRLEGTRGRRHVDAHPIEEARHQTEDDRLVVDAQDMDPRGSRAGSSGTR